MGRAGGQGWHRAVRAEDWSGQVFRSEQGECPTRLGEKLK